MIKKYPAATLEINANQVAVAERTKARRAQEELIRNRLWFICPACAHPYDRPFKAGCYCKKDDEGSYVATPLVRLQTDDQDAAEAAFRLGGIEAVYNMVREKLDARR